MSHDSQSLSAPQPTKTIEDTIVSLARAMKIGRLPTDVVETAKLVLADTLGVAWAGARDPDCQAALELMLAEGGKPVSRVWGTTQRLPARSAAFVNGVFSAGLDYDALHLKSVTHAAVVVIPAALALAEERGANGSDTLRAIIAGMELICNLAENAKRSGEYFETSFFGVFGAALAAALVIGLDDDKARQAVGMALSLAGGTKQPISERKLVKRYQSAFAAQSGVLCAQMAEQGVTSPGQFITGKSGLSGLVDGIDVEAFRSSFGSRFLSTETSIKPFPVCYCSIAAINATLTLKSKRNIRPQDVASLTVTVTPYTYETVGRPFDPTHDPQVAGMFSIQYAIACVLMFGEFRLANVEAQGVRSDPVGQLARRIKVDVNQAWPGEFAPMVLRAVLTDGTTIEERIEETPSVVPTESRALLSEKILDCLRASGCNPTRENVQKIFDAIERFEHLNECSEVYSVWPVTPAASS